MFQQAMVSFFFRIGWRCVDSTSYLGFCLAAWRVFTNSLHYFEIYCLLFIQGCFHRSWTNYYHQHDNWQSSKAGSRHLFCCCDCCRSNRFTQNSGFLNHFKQSTLNLELGDQSNNDFLPCHDLCSFAVHVWNGMAEFKEGCQRKEASSRRIQSNGHTARFRKDFVRISIEHEKQKSNERKEGG